MPSGERTLQETEAELLAALNELAIARARTGTAIDPQLIAELERLQALEGELSGVRDRWASYREEVAGAMDTGEAVDNVALLGARVSLERFLSDEVMRRYFPEMSGEIERFDDAFIASGRENALLDASDLLMDLTVAESAGERIALVRAARAGATPAYLDFLSELESLLGSM